MKSDTSKCREVLQRCAQHIEQFRVNLGEELIHKIVVQIESQEERERKEKQSLTLRWQKEEGMRE